MTNCCYASDSRSALDPRVWEGDQENLLLTGLVVKDLNARLRADEFKLVGRGAVDSCKRVWKAAAPFTVGHSLQMDVYSENGDDLEIMVNNGRMGRSVYINISSSGMIAVITRVEPGRHVKDKVAAQFLKPIQYLKWLTS